MHDGQREILLGRLKRHPECVEDRKKVLQRRVLGVETKTLLQNAFLLVVHGVFLGGADARRTQDLGGFNFPLLPETQHSAFHRGVLQPQRVVPWLDDRGVDGILLLALFVLARGKAGEHLAGERIGEALDAAGQGAEEIQPLGCHYVARHDAFQGRLRPGRHVGGQKVAILLGITHHGILQTNARYGIAEKSLARKINGNHDRNHRHRHIRGILLMAVHEEDRGLFPEQVHFLRIGASVSLHPGLIEESIGNLLGRIGAKTIQLIVEVRQDGGVEIGRQGCCLQRHGAYPEHHCQEYKYRLY